MVDSPRDLKTSEFEVIGAIDGGLKLIAHMLQEEVDRDQILTIVRTASRTMSDLKRLCTKRKRLTGKMAQVVAEQRRMLKSAQERQQGFESTRDQVERLQVTVRDLQLKNDSLERKVKELNETRAIVEKKNTLPRALVSLGIQTNMVEQVESCDDEEEEEEEKENSKEREIVLAENVLMLKASSETQQQQQQQLQEKLKQVETENQNLRGEMGILIEDVEYHRNEMKKQASIMSRLNTIIGSQKKMIRALKGDDDIIIRKRENSPLHPRPPLSPVPHVSARDRDWNHRRVKPIEDNQSFLNEDEDEYRSDRNASSRRNDFLSRSFPPDRSTCQDDEEDED